MLEVRKERHHFRLERLILIEEEVIDLALEEGVGLEQILVSYMVTCRWKHVS